MREVLRTNDSVLRSLAESLLRRAVITSVVADPNTLAHRKASIDSFPRRLLVQTDD
jgi:putative signal transducing protein